MEKDNIKQNTFSSTDPNYWKNSVNDYNSSKVTTPEKSLIPGNQKHNLCNTLVLRRKTAFLWVMPTFIKHFQKHANNVSCK